MKKMLITKMEEGAYFWDQVERLKRFNKTYSETLRHAHIATDRWLKFNQFQVAQS